jgi:diguanylate cyclase (GGDEF)-like protein
VYVRLRERDRERAYASDTAARERFQREILDSVTNPMVVVDGAGCIVRANPAWDDLWPNRRPDPDHPSQRWAGVPYTDVLAPEAVDGIGDLEHALAGVLDQRHGTTDVDVALRARDGADQVPTVIDADAGPTTLDADQPMWLGVRVTPLRDRRGAILIHTDITERKRTQAQLEVQAARDVLTGLANRSTFEERLARALVVSRPDGDRVAVLFIDLDGFKPVNDTYGHAIGDEVLRSIGRRIGSVVRGSDTAGRLGGDEFAVLIDPLTDASVASASADRILAALSSPIRTNAGEVTLGASIGVAVVGTPTSESAASVIQRADAAMYASKQQGGARATVLD